MPTLSRVVLTFQRQPLERQALSVAMYSFRPMPSRRSRSEAVKLGMVSKLLAVQVEQQGWVLGSHHSATQTGRESEKEQADAPDFMAALVRSQ